MTIAGVFLIAFLFRYMLVTHMPRPVISDLIWNDSTGWNLAQGRGFTASLTGYVPAIFRTPGYPAFLAIIYTFFGHSIHAALVGNAVLDSLTAVLVLLIGWRLLGPLSGAVAGVLYALYPYPAIFCTVLHQDILLTLSVVLTLYLTLLAQGDPNRFSRWLLVGVMIGVTAMVKPFLALYGVVPALVVLASRQLTLAKKFKAVAVMVIMSVLVITPWVIRNYRAFHSFPPLAAGGTGANLGIIVAEVKGQGAPVVPSTVIQSNEDDLDGQQLLDSERKYGQLYGPQLRQVWPGWLKLSILQIPRLWVTRQTEGYSHLVSLAAPIIGLFVLLPGLIGMYLLRRRWRSLLAIYASIVLITLLYAPVPIEARYTLPVRPAMILFVAATLVFLYQRVRRVKQAR